MQRSKQQALMFLTGAVIVGGAIGISADRMTLHFKEKKAQEKAWITRPSFFEDLGFTAAQRAAWEAISDSTECRMREITTEYRPRLDSLQEASRDQLGKVMTPDQVKKLELRRQETRQRDSVRRAQITSGRGPSRGGDGPPGGRGGPGFGRGGNRPGGRLNVALCQAMKERSKP